MMLFFNAPQRHPFCPARPLIHYELALVLMPAMLAGSNLGVLVNRICPATLLVSLALVLLLLTTLKTITKARHLTYAARAVRLTEAARKAAVASKSCTVAATPSTGFLSMQHVPAGP